MKTLVDQLSHYAAYHRDRRNVVTHFLGIPMIVQAVAILLTRPSMEWLSMQWSLASLAVIASVLYYLMLDLRYGVVMALLFGAMLAIASMTASLTLVSWLTLGVGLFVVGWILQFIGHIYERRKPAFFDDVMGLIVGPLFIVAEAGFMVGLRSEIHAAIEGRVGGAEASERRGRTGSGAARGLG